MNGIMKARTAELPFDVKDDTQDLNSFKFPFKSVLSLRYLIEYWELLTRNSNPVKAEFAKKVLELVKNSPELYEPIEDLSVLTKHKNILDLLMSIIYPAALWETQVAASLVPFSPNNTIYSTPSYDRIIGSDMGSRYKKMMSENKAAHYGKILIAYSLVLKYCYNIELKISFPFIVNVPDLETELDRYYQLNIDGRFTRIIPKGELKPVTENDIEKLKKDLFNFKLWSELIPPDNFEFHGFSTVTATQVTDNEIISSLKYDLLERETIISQEKFLVLRQKMRALFRLPELQLGLTAFPDDNNLFLTSGKKIGDSFILNDSCKASCSSLYKSIYNKAVKTGKPIIIEDIEKFAEKTEIEINLINQGLKSILVAPLYYKNEAIGFLELGSPNANDLNALSVIKLGGVVSLFATAVKRSMDEWENDIQAIIKEECTAIHPTVEWRFRQAAVNLMNKRENETGSNVTEMESIIFDNIYPLYGLTDIRNSSVLRSQAVQSDLIEQLTMIQNIISSANSFKPLHFLEELNYRIQKHIDKISRGLSSGDEVTVLEFLRNEVESVFSHISGLNSSLNELIIQYQKSLDPNLNVLYRKRRDFEESVSLVNESISNYLEEAEEAAQEMFPHYFEKYKTDGVEHGIYIGESLVPGRNFNLLYLKNLRLWQLMITCGIVKEAEKIKALMKIPLDTTHLILVHNSPLSIRFRQDEKKFDVDGAYNIRYEIMKKRIDKALVKGTGERLTQPGKIAVIYSQAKEASEYKKYIEFLQFKGMAAGKTEDLELDDLQGVQGLRALRFDVSIDSKPKEKINVKEIEKVSERIEKIIN